MSTSTTTRRREAAREAALASAVARMRAERAIVAALAARTTVHAQLVEWNGPVGEEYAVFELDSSYKRTSDYPVSTGTFESEHALALTYEQGI